MFEVGFTEIVLIFGIALLVLGPARLPKLAADLGRWAGRARAMARQLRSQLEQEVQFDPLAQQPAARSPHADRETIHTPQPATTADPTARAMPAQSVPDAVMREAPSPASAATGDAPDPPSSTPTAASSDERPPG